MPGRQPDWRSRLARLERLLAALEARRVEAPLRRSHTDAEVCEISLVQLCYVFEGDEGRYAEYLEEHGMDSEKAQRTARLVGNILAKRREMAENPECPV